MTRIYADGIRGYANGHRTPSTVHLRPVSLHQAPKSYPAVPALTTTIQLHRDFASISFNAHDFIKPGPPRQNDELSFVG